MALVRRVLIGALALAAALAMRALRPIRVVRIGGMNSSRIGPFASRPEMYLCQRDAGVHDGRTFDIFFHASLISNQQLRRMWDRTLRVWQFAKAVNRVSNGLPGASAHIIPPPPARDTEGYLAKYPPHLSFTPEEEARGQAELRKMDVPPGAQFVSFHARDSAYLKAMHPRGDWSHHDYRDCEIENYLAASEEMVGRGYFALRMGAVVGEPLNGGSPGVIDYATNHRTDFMDIYLSAKCRFFLTSGAGIESVSRIFRRPTAYADAIPIEQVATWGPDDLFIPKRLWMRAEKRFMTFREILDSGAGRFMKSEQYDQHGLEVVGNSADEIEALAIEMDDRLNGTWRASDGDEELQQRFWSLYQPSELIGVFLSRIGADFLQRNRELLD